MKVDAAELVAQVLVGLLIALILEGRNFVGKQTRLNKMLHDDWPAGSFDEESLKLVGVVGIMMYVATTSSALALALCLKSVISDRPMSIFEAQAVALSLVLSIVFAALMPALETFILFLEKSRVALLSRSKASHMLISLAAALCTLFLVFGCLLIMAFSVSG